MSEQIATRFQVSSGHLLFFCSAAVTHRHLRALLLCLLLFSTDAFAVVSPSQDQARPGVYAQQVSQAPLIDGQLDETIWEGACGISDFYQKEPLEGQQATEPTRVCIAYDQANLYVGVELQDSEPDRIRASQLQRDSTLEGDDTFTVILDTFHDHRNAFLFRVNPLGTRFDALIRNESDRVSSEWDEQWTEASVITGNGWTAEYSIPFKILRFSAAAEQTWGINFERVIKRKNEFVYWSGWNRNFQFNHVSQAGHLEGLSEITQEERLRIRPYVVAGLKRLAADRSNGTQKVWDVGIDDLKFALTSNLTADLAFNPDFGQVEVDAQQVNLTRFSLFFQEKRQFFIEGADSLKMRVSFLHFGPPPLELFYSRRIGLSESGQPISIVGGGKLTGKVGGFDLGVLNVQTDDYQQQPGENFMVARVRKEILGRSYIGTIFTNRQSQGDANRLAGVDANFVLKDHLTLGGLFAKSSSTGISGKQTARQLGVLWQDALISAGVNYIDIDPDFDPGIGFARRRDRMIGARFYVRPRPGGDLIRNFEFNPDFVYFHDDANVLKSRTTRLQLAAVFQSGDRLQFNLRNDLERLSREFQIGPGVTLPVGTYQWNAASLSFRSFNGRSFAGSAGVDIGNFYNGTKRSLNLDSNIRPNENINFIPSYRFNAIDLREGAFNTHLVGIRANVSFTNNLLTSAFLQYNSSGDLAALQLRFNYIFRTIDNFHIVYNETRYTDGVFSGISDRSLTTKITYSLHR